MMYSIPFNHGIQLKFIAVMLTLFIGMVTPKVQAEELARVDDVVITSESFTAAVKALGNQGTKILTNPELKRKFLDHMINSQLVAKKAKSEGFESDARYKERLKEMSNQLLAGEYMDRLVEKQSNGKNLKAWFNENQQLFSSKEVHAHHILCDSESTAKKALVEVQKQPNDFDTIAKKYSKDKSVDLGFFGHGRMVPEFESVAFRTKKGEISSEIAKTQFGWHVIQIVDIRNDEPVKYEAVASDVEHRYRQKLQENLVHELRNKSKVAINEKSLKDAH